MKKYILYLSILASVFYTACDPESFEQVVEFEIPAETPRLVVNCDYLNSSDSIQVFVSKSWNTNKENGETSVKNATVELWDGTQKVASIPYRLTQKGTNYNNATGANTGQGSQSYYSTKIGKLLDANKAYTIKVSAAGFESVEAKSTMPKLIKINNATYTKKGFKPKGSGGFGGGGGIANNIDLISFNIEDVLNENNYYILKVRKVLKDTVTKKLYYTQSGFEINQKFSAASDDFFDDSNSIWDGKLDFTDELFDGKTFNIKLGVESGNGFFFSNILDENGNYVNSNFDKLVTEGYDISLYSQSKERFYFANSLRTFYNNEGNPFGEPIPLYTNFDKGFGIFSFIELSKVFVKKK